MQINVKVFLTIWCIFVNKSAFMHFFTPVFCIKELSVSMISLEDVCLSFFD